MSANRLPATLNVEQVAAYLGNRSDSPEPTYYTPTVEENK